MRGYGTKVLRHYIETGSFEKMPEADRLNTSGKYRDAVEGLEAEDISMRRKTEWDRTMFADGGNKKNTARNEAALKHLGPSSNGVQEVIGCEARLNAITDPATNHTAKVVKIYERLRLWHRKLPKE